MKLNESKCHLLACGIKEEVVANIGNSSIIEIHEEKLLGVTIDRELKFKKHGQSIYSRAGKKLNALARLCTILSFNKRKVLMNAFVMSQFASSPLIGMFVDRTLNSKINAMHFRALKIVYRDNVSTFDELLKRDNSVRVHHRNIQFLAIEMFKVKLGIAPSFMNDTFQKRSQSEFYNYNNPRTVLYGTETIRCLGPKIWKNLPYSIKTSSNKVFKENVKKWIPTNCPCRLCKPFHAGLGFV